MALSSQHTEGMCTDANVKMAELMVVQLQIVKLLIFSVLPHFLVGPNILRTLLDSQNIYSSLHFSKRQLCSRL